MKAPLLVGAYQARSLIASAQRCVNLYLEKNPESEDFPTTHYPTPGLALLSDTSYQGWRCLYASSDGRLFGVVGQAVVEVNEDFTLTKLGQIASTSVPVHMLDNGTTIAIVDGTSAGYTVQLAGSLFATINDPAFYGSSRIDLVDGYFLLNRPNTREWYISLVNQAVLDPLDFATKSGWPDKLVGVAATKRNVFLFGEQTTECWTNTGGTDFPFSRLSGAFIQFGCVTANSLAEADGSIYWLSRSKEGHAMVLRTASYDRERISTFAIEQELQTYARIDDAFGFVQQMFGHYWYVLTFPSANKTWVYDVATSEWHERLYLEEDGTFSRHRAGCFAFWKGRQIVGDYANGKLYEMKADVFTDNGNEIRRVRSFPHLSDNGNRMYYRSFQAAMEPGTVPYASPNEIRLRYSDTKGLSWGGYVSASLGEHGDHYKDVYWTRLGSARNRVFELSWSANCDTALSGAYIRVDPGSS